MKKKLFIYHIIILAILFFSCKRENKSINRLFENEVFLNPTYSYFEKDSLANPYCFEIIDSFLIVHDVFELKHFTLYNINSISCVKRFGNIGNGPGEVLIGHVLSVKQGKLYSHATLPNVLIQYNLDSLINYKSYHPTTIAKFEQIPKLFLSRFSPVEKSYFIGAGLYNSKYQYVLFNLKGEVLDSAQEVFNSKESYNDIYKFLSNQGILKNHPTENKFVYSVSRSSNIDFLDVSNEKIHLIKSYRLDNPQFKPQELGNQSYSVNYDPHSVIGFLDIFPGKNYVYTLYSDKSVIDNKSYSSNIVLVFDWEGNPIVKYILNKEVYYIGVDEDRKKFYTIQKDDDGGWVIAYFDFHNSPTLNVINDEIEKLAYSR